ncbi:MAG: ArsR/SmtB family transcription factor [Brevinema sp.]
MKKPPKPRPAIYERQIHLDISYPAHALRVEQICRALSSPVRLKMLQALHTRPLSASEVAVQFQIPLSSATFNLRLLEEAGLLVIQSQSGIRGVKNVASTTIDLINIMVTNNASFPEDKVISVEMPIGKFSHCDIHPSCGMADENGIIEILDDPRVFYDLKATNAQLLWFQQGFIEYRFPNNFPCIEDNSLKSISFSLELCSEVSGFSDNWPSDIEIKINDIPTAVYHSPGDFGSRKGKLTPDIWGYGSTQYGLLKTFIVNQQGSFIDEHCVSEEITIDTLNLAQKPYISFKIECSPNAPYCGGVNIFGSKYGDFPQHIIMRVNY